MLGLKPWSELLVGEESLNHGDTMKPGIALAKCGEDSTSNHGKHVELLRTV
jgi:hypothetical protein